MEPKKEPDSPDLDGRTNPDVDSDSESDLPTVKGVGGNGGGGSLSSMFADSIKSPLGGHSSSARSAGGPPSAGVGMLSGMLHQQLASSGTIHHHTGLSPGSDPQSAVAASLYCEQFYGSASRLAGSYVYPPPSHHHHHHNLKSYDDLGRL